MMRRMLSVHVQAIPPMQTRFKQQMAVIFQEVSVADPEIYFGWCQPRLRGYKGMHIYNTDYDRFK